jgi:hypothetical protein
LASLPYSSGAIPSKDQQPIAVIGLAEQVNYLIERFEVRPADLRPITP